MNTGHWENGKLTGNRKLESSQQNHSINFAMLSFPWLELLLPI
jgi:hypothetical protein